MRARNSASGWGWPARALHWVMAALMFYQLGLGVYAADFVPDLIAQFRLVQLHKSLGFVVFALALVRLAWRLAAGPVPAAPRGTPAWQARASAASHALLYVLMFALPLSGWVMASASPTQDLLQMQNLVFGSFALPDPWVPGVAAVEAAAKAVHVASAWLLAALLAIHVAAAMKHHFRDGDDVLARMIRG